MADKLKPYDPNKGFISFRLNPDAIKEEALNLIPWPVGTIAREMYRNPDGSIVETAKQVGRETPVLGSLLSGEYSDAAKEAFLLGMPVNNAANSPLSRSPKIKKEIALNPNREYFNYGGDLYYKDKYRGKDHYINQYDKSDRLPVNDYYETFEGNNTGTFKYKDNKQVLDDLNVSERVYDDLEPVPNPPPGGLTERSSNLQKHERAIDVADQFLSSHKLPKNKEIYTNGFNVILWDPKKNMGSEYAGWSTRNNNLVFDSPTPAKQPNKYWNKVDQQFRNQTPLERKLLEQDAELFNINYEPLSVDDFIPATADNLSDYRWNNNTKYDLH